MLVVPRHTADTSVPIPHAWKNRRDVHVMGEPPFWLQCRPGSSEPGFTVTEGGFRGMVNRTSRNNRQPCRIRVGRVVPRGGALVAELEWMVGKQSNKKRATAGSVLENGFVHHRTGSRAANIRLSRVSHRGGRSFSVRGRRWSRGGSIGCLHRLAGGLGASRRGKVPLR